MNDSTGAINPANAKSALNLISEWQDTVVSLVLCIEGRLAEACNEGGPPPDDAPIVVWRLSQVLNEFVEDTTTLHLAATFMGLDDDFNVKKEPCHD